MNWAVAILSCPREQPTLEATLNSLRAAGWIDCEVIIDPNLDGCYRNWRRCAAWAIADERADRFLICEDDIRLTIGLRAYLESSQHSIGKARFPSEGVVSLYCGAINHHPEGGWHQVEKLPKHCHGALATVWTRELLEGFLKYDRSDEFANGTDTHIGMWCRRNKVPYWCHSPSFVRHTGVTSAIDPMWDTAQQEYRQCKEFLERV